MAGEQSVPLGHLNERQKAFSSWDDFDATKVMVRGANYLQDKVKIPSKASAFNLVGVHTFSSKEEFTFATEKKSLPVYERKVGSSGKPPFLLVVHWDATPQHMTMAMELDEKQLEEDEGFRNAWTRFLAGDDEYKNKRLKLIPSLVEASWIVRAAVGRAVPCIIGNKLAVEYKQSQDMLEIVIHTSSSMVGRLILGVVKPATNHMVVDLMFCIEGQQPDELPERMIGGARVIKSDMSKYQAAD